MITFYLYTRLTFDPTLHFALGNMDGGNGVVSGGTGQRIDLRQVLRRYMYIHCTCLFFVVCFCFV